MMQDIIFSSVETIAEVYVIRGDDRYAQVYVMPRPDVQIENLDEIVIEVISYYLELWSDEGV